MHLTRHARSRILRRTNLKPIDVLSFVTEGAAVSLGTYENYEYLLFYSPFDRCCKIAVVSLDRASLVSVWYDDYLLPGGVAKPTASSKKQARKAYLSFMFKRMERKPRPKKVCLRNEPSPPYYNTEIEVIVRGESVFSLSSITLTHKQGYVLGNCLYLVLPDLFKLAEIVEAHKESFGGSTVQYGLSLKAINGLKSSRHYVISHKHVLRNLSKRTAT